MVRVFSSCDARFDLGFGFGLGLELWFIPSIDLPFTGDARSILRFELG